MRFAFAFALTAAIAGPSYALTGDDFALANRIFGQPTAAGVISDIEGEWLPLSTLANVDGPIRILGSSPACSTAFAAMPLSAGRARDGDAPRNRPPPDHAQDRFRPICAAAKAERHVGVANERSSISMTGIPNPDHADRNGMTPLMLAAAVNDYHNVLLFLEHGADPLKRDRLGDDLQDMLFKGLDRALLHGQANRVLDAIIAFLAKHRIAVNAATAQLLDFR